MKTTNKKPSRKTFIITLIVILIVASGVFAYLYTLSKKDVQDDSLDYHVPTVQSSNNDDSTNSTTSSNNTNDSSQNSNKKPTKTEGKTPAQYEGERVDDEPIYNNEQFRIPEEDLE